MTFKRSTAGGVRALLALTLLAAAAACASSHGTSVLPVQPPLTDSMRAGPSRAELEAMSAQADREAQSATDPDVKRQKQAEAAALHDRLTNGDYHAGDRIALVVRGDSTLTDTVLVRGGRVIQLPNLPDISLQGVLHSELEPYLTKQLSKYLRNPDVRAQSLVQIAILGPVGHPGFYNVPIDMTLTDAIMLAGGPGQQSDVNDTKVIRNNKEVYGSDAVQHAFTSGTTLDQMSVRAGDQIVVGEKGKKDWLRILQVVSLAAGIAVSIWAISNR
ncbi:MAG TPA: SLBB domain-containing protein [Gemmatimonadaceae bacterium]|nr:SLBB domain-containing protein [Gemmatimonadaceae bacterium]HET7620693.1 SLBB domain-containing protein [Gemmatimonadaceae bacterium]